ncbi:hypothetical protein B0T24DRAFT_370907 [Lasiosphaeria ovina]|uniref:Uncharacterized protein n=1 Tax=Lasiosphaeria ovina TaxID=92902 RepID=A0AAE0N2D1_9PEZI|nr:hypothetical protein B0T24DRAFT_370907 [Lasiosphaeria ovina]
MPQNAHTRVGTTADSHGLIPHSPPAAPAPPQLWSIPPGFVDCRRAMSVLVESLNTTSCRRPTILGALPYWVATLATEFEQIILQLHGAAYADGAASASAGVTSRLTSTNASAPQMHLPIISCSFQGSRRSWARVGREKDAAYSQGERRSRAGIMSTLPSPPLFPGYPSTGPGRDCLTRDDLSTMFRPRSSPKRDGHEEGETCSLEKFGPSNLLGVPPDLEQSSSEYPAW